jgi:hypothetical protein
LKRIISDAQDALATGILPLKRFCVFALVSESNDLALGAQSEFVSIRVAAQRNGHAKVGTPDYFYPPR